MITNSTIFKSICVSTLLFCLSYCLSAQDCSSADDCLEKGRNSNFTNQAVEYLTQGIKYAKKEKKNPSQLYFERGKKYYNQSSAFKDAEKDFLQAIKLNPEYYWPYSWLGALYQTKSRDYDKANKWLDGVVEKFPDDPRSYYDRAHNNRYFNHMDLAYVDFENAYNLLILMMDAAEDIDSQTKGNICRWYSIAYLKKNSIYVYDITALEILETGASLAPDSPILLGELALAYYDNDEMTKAREVGLKAVSLDKETYNSKNVGGNFIVGMDAYNKKQLYDAASYLGYADMNLAHPHPLVYYYLAVASWEYNLSMYDTNPNLWNNSVGKITNRLELTVQYGAGNKYQYLVDYAKKNLEQLKK